jgi:hypothetical protein
MITLWGWSAHLAQAISLGASIPFVRFEMVGRLDASPAE